MTHINNFVSRSLGRGIVRMPLRLGFFVILACCASAPAQTTAFTYQGKLADNHGPLTGHYDFEFRLIDAGGYQQGSTVPLSDVEVSNGIFTVQLDFNACPTCVPCSKCFDGSDRLLDISVRPTGGGAFRPLTPRQPVTSNPYAIRSKDATAADSLTCLGCVTSSQISSVNGSAVTGTIPVASVPAGSSNYIQNSTTPQPLSSFDINSGHFSGGVRIEGLGFILPDTPSLSLSSTGSLKVDAPFLPGGRFTLLENGNVGIGNGAPTQKLEVVGNGTFSGSVNAGTQFNIAGQRALFLSADSSANTFLGASAGVTSALGFYNSFFGHSAGSSLQGDGSFNSFFGAKAGMKTAASAYSNSFFGAEAGLNNVGGQFNSFFGVGAGLNSLSSDNTFLGFEAGWTNATGSQNTYVGNRTGEGAADQSHNVFIGYRAGEIANTGSDNTLIGYRTNVSPNVSGATAIGADTFATESGQIALGTPSNTVRVNGKLEAYGQIRFSLSSIGSGGTNHLCWNPSTSPIVLAECSSSIRYKKNINAFASSLSLISRLSPVSFNWKDGGMRDIGLVAEDVAAVEPLLITRNQKGEIEGVKYDRLGVVLINAVKEQQAQIARQEKLIESQQVQIDALKNLVCSMNANAGICKGKVR